MFQKILPHSATKVPSIWECKACFPVLSSSTVYQTLAAWHKISVEIKNQLMLERKDVRTLSLTASLFQVSKRGCFKTTLYTKALDNYQKAWDAFWFNLWDWTTCLSHTQSYIFLWLNSWWQDLPVVRDTSNYDSRQRHRLISPTP